MPSRSHTHSSPRMALLIFMHSILSGKIGAAPLGKVSLKAGDHRDVKVTLNSSPKQGMRLQAVIEKSGQPLKYSGDIPERTFKVL